MLGYVITSKSLLLLPRILGIPFWGMLYLFSFILYKDMHISPLQIALIVVLKPTSALIAPYWSHLVAHAPHQLRHNFVVAHGIKYLPFLFFPWISSPWWMMGSFAFFMIFHRGSLPAWIELVKCTTPSAIREKLIAYGSVMDYIGSALLPLVLGIMLDFHPQAWRWLFSATACLGLSATLFLQRLPQVSPNPPSLPPPPYTILGPMKATWDLLKEHRGFRHYQMGFLLGAAGLMIIQPALPMFFVDLLGLSYTKMLLALGLCKGIGFAVATPLWVAGFKRYPLLRFAAVVSSVALTSLLLLMGSPWHTVFLYLSYAVYGMMQAGSELSWHMSGPYFSAEKNSTLYSSANVLIVGVRGCIFPCLGTLMYAMGGISLALLSGAVLCAASMIYLMRAPTTVSDTTRTAGSTT